MPTNSLVWYSRLSTRPVGCLGSEGGGTSMFSGVRVQRERGARGDRCTTFARVLPLVARDGAYGCGDHAPICPSCGISHGGTFRASICAKFNCCDMRITSMIEGGSTMPKAPYQRLEHLNFRLDVLSALAKNVASGLYEAECGVTLRDLRVLRFVDMQPGISLGPLVDLTYIEKTLVSKLVTTLAKRGLLTRSTGTTDARVINLHLTRKGKG